jgi:polyisoprenyl-teichoic acid--peptidoglycan teichoic acid transferase
VDRSGRISKYLSSGGCWLAAALAVLAILGLGLVVLISRSGSPLGAWLPRPLQMAGTEESLTTVTPAVALTETAVPTATLTPLPTLTPTSTSTARPLRPLDPGEDTVPAYYHTPEPWEGQERVTILLLGVDSGDWDSPGRAGPPRTDTLLVLSVDPVAKTAGMLSIPRDLTVDIPGILNPNRINTAHRFGEIYDMPGGGPGLTMRTVENLLGMPVDYYVRIDFRAFERIIDEIGGIVVDVPHEIRVDPLGPDNVITLEPGAQFMDGPTALAYARARNTLRGDFDRILKQQQVVLAVREQVLSLEMLPLLIFKAPRLFQELRDGLQSDLPLDLVFRLAWLSRSIKPGDIQTGAIGSNQLYREITEEGLSVYRAHLERVRWLRDQVFLSP